MGTSKQRIGVTFSMTLGSWYNTSYLGYVSTHCSFFGMEYYVFMMSWWAINTQIDPKS